MPAAVVVVYPTRSDRRSTERDGAGDRTGNAALCFTVGPRIDVGDGPLPTLVGDALCLFDVDDFGSCRSSLPSNEPLLLSSCSYVAGDERCGTPTETGGSG